MKGKKSVSPLSPTLVKYLHPRVEPKMAEGMTPEEAWRDVIKDVAVASLSSKPLDIFAAAICRLAELDDNGRLQIIDRCLTICPVPEAPPTDKAAQIEELLLEMLVPENTSELRGTTSVEIDSEFLRVMTNVLENSHKDWSSAREFLQRFFNDCKTKYIPDLEIFYLFPKMPEMARNLIIEPAEAKNLERLFACLQEACAVKGLRLRELIKTKISGRDYEWFDKQASVIFPNGIPSDPEPNIDYIPPTKIDTSLPFTKERDGQLMRSGRLKTQQQLLRPRWHNQQHILLLALRRHPQHRMTRNELIDAALQLDEKWSRETGLPKCFTGLTPRNSASACLTTNADKYFTAIKVDNVTTYYKLSFKPNDLDDAIARYKKWVKQLQEHDWPLCFGRVLKGKRGQDLMKNQRIIMLSVGASNPAHLRCRYCGPEKDGCSKELPACARCKAKGQLCIYPLRPDVHKETERQKQKSEQNSFLSKKSHSDGRSVNLRAKRVSEEKKARKNGNGSSYEIELLENIQEGMDLSNVPKRLCDVVDVRPSSIPNAGNGLFAKRNIPMGTPLGFYFGVPMMEDEFDQYKDKVGKASHYSMRYRHTILDATNDVGEPFTDPNGKIYCPFHFMNEDPFGNMVFLEGYEVNQVICLSKRDIRKGEELFVYYGHEVDRAHWGQQESESSDSDEDEDDESEDENEDEESLVEDDSGEEIGKRNGRRSGRRNGNNGDSGHRERIWLRGTKRKRGNNGESRELSNKSKRVKRHRLSTITPVSDEYETDIEIGLGPSRRDDDNKMEVDEEDEEKDEEKVDEEEGGERRGKEIVNTEEEEREDEENKEEEEKEKDERLNKSEDIVNDDYVEVKIEELD